MQRSAPVVRAAILFCAAAMLPFPALPQQHSAKTTTPWGSLVPGPYHVGFRSYFALDHGRRDSRTLSIEQEKCITKYLAEFDDSTRDVLNAPPHQHGCGTLKESDRPHPQLLAFRPVLVAMWYPASTLSSVMKMSDYLRFPEIVAFPGFSSRLKKFGKKTFKETLFGKQPNLLPETKQLAFNEIFNMKTRAHKNAMVAAGRFPTVVYHPGASGSYEENAILAEYLASHGYVVIASAYQTNTVHVSNDFGDKSRSIRDMQFLLQEVSRFPYVDSTRVAGVGHSAGAQTLLLWIGEADCPLTAMVSLDTTVEYTAPDFPGHKEYREALESMDKPTIPVMLFASAERSPDFGRFDVFLRQAPRYEVSVLTFAITITRAKEQCEPQQS
jgi:hypothetical protein